MTGRFHIASIAVVFIASRSNHVGGPEGAKRYPSLTVSLTKDYSLTCFHGYSSNFVRKFTKYIRIAVAEPHSGTDGYVILLFKVKISQSVLGLTR